MGSFFEALSAGTSPKTTPVKIEIAKVMMTISILMYGVKGVMTRIMNAKM